MKFETRLDHEFDWESRTYPRVYLIDGKRVSKAEYDAALPDKPMIEDGRIAAMFAFKPIASDALAVHPRQVKEAIADSIKKGVPTEFLPDGRPVLRTRQHKKAYTHAYGFFDKAASYSDAQYGGPNHMPEEPVDMKSLENLLVMTMTDGRQSTIPDEEMVERVKVRSKPKKGKRRGK